MSLLSEHRSGRRGFRSSKIMGKAHWLSLWAAVLLSPGVALAARPITLDAHTTIFIDAKEPLPIQKAAKDLSSDFAAVFGHPAVLTHDPSLQHSATIRIALTAPLPAGMSRPGGWERFLIASIPENGSPRTIVLTGSDIRGTIYAIYEFSQKYLGIDPLYWWTDQQPQRRTHIDLPARLNDSEAPRFKYRGWFVNDEDLLTGWTPGNRDGTGISLATWDRIFEALLRLKGNMVVPGTWIFPYEPQLQAAADRGLILAEHHVNVLGLDTFKWPKDQPYSFIAHPELLEAAWKRAVSQYPAGAELVGSVGYRGQNDYPFWIQEQKEYPYWVDDKNAPKTDAGRANVINEAVKAEIDIFRKLHPRDPIVLNAWQEGAGFVREGLLKAPEGVTLVWADDGYGYIQDKGTLSKGEGVYYHTALYDDNANHFTEMLPLSRMQEELGRAVDAGATQYLLLNTSNLRPVLMTTRAVMELVWNPDPWKEKQAGENYLRKWAAAEFGAAAGNDIVNYYNSYFNAPAHFGEQKNQIMEDNFYQTASRDILLQLIGGQPSNEIHLAEMPGASVQDMSQHILDWCRGADSRWERTLQLAGVAQDKVPAERQQFFLASISVPAMIQLHSNRMLEAVAEATTSSSPNEKKLKIEAAIREGEATEAALETADYGKWRGFYTDGDWLVDVPRTLALLRAYQDQLNGMPVPENAVIRANDYDYGYWMITAYQGTQQVKVN